jgi:predicted ABC-type exoprotein transport system permease subunit
MKKNSFLESLVSIVTLFVFIAVIYSLYLDWIEKVKNPKTRNMTIVSTVVLAIVMSSMIVVHFGK